MARIEGEQHGDKGRVREWLARAVNAPRDPAWTADGVVPSAGRRYRRSPARSMRSRWRVPVEAADKARRVARRQARGARGARHAAHVHGARRGGRAADRHRAHRLPPRRAGASRAVRRDREAGSQTSLRRAAQAEPAPEQPRREAAASPSAESAVPATGTKRRQPWAAPVSPSVRARRRPQQGRAGTREARIRASACARRSGPETPEPEDVTLPLRPQRA